ncbi:hypothetical protein BH24ACI5_BH24ACI5_28720 [soil metagenome]
MLQATAVFLLMVLAAVPGFAQSDVAKTFEHYEAIRVALADDELKGVAGHARALAPLAEAIGGPEARKAAAGIGEARDIKVARERFGVLSASLLPKFEAASLEGVHLFTCGMVSQSWAQRGQKVQNPYMGKSMLTCGSPYEGKK